MLSAKWLLSKLIFPPANATLNGLCRAKILTLATLTTMPAMICSRSKASASK